MWIQTIQPMGREMLEDVWYQQNVTIRIIKKLALLVLSACTFQTIPQIYFTAKTFAMLHQMHKVKAINHAHKLNKEVK